MSWLCGFGVVDCGVVVVVVAVVVVVSESLFAALVFVSEQTREDPSTTWGSVEQGSLSLSSILPSVLSEYCEVRV